MGMREINQFGLRMPIEVRRWLEDQAVAHRRSLNSEILVCLEEVRRMQQEPAGSHAR